MTAKGKKPKGWKPVTVAQQKLNTQKQIRHLRRKKPVSVQQQRKVHAHQLMLLHKAKVAKAHHHAKAKTHGAPLAADGVPCCSAQAVAESRRLALGVPYSDADVLALHAAAGGTEHAGTSILDALSAAQWDAPFALSPVPAALTCCGFSACSRALANRPDRQRLYDAVQAPQQASSLILGLDLPDGRRHAVVADGGVWWSWGEPYEPRTDVVITEAWAVTW